MGGASLGIQVQVTGMGKVWGIGRGSSLGVQVWGYKLEV